MWDVQYKCDKKTETEIKDVSYKEMIYEITWMCDGFYPFIFFNILCWAS